MGKPIYEKLFERLNRFESKVPPVESLYQLLEEIYSEEEAALAEVFPEGSFTSAQLARELNKDPLKLDSLLEQMADNGQIFVLTDRTGEKKYQLAPWMPGVIEFSIIRRMDTPKIKTRKVFPLPVWLIKSRSSANAGSAWAFKTGRSKTNHKS